MKKKIAVVFTGGTIGSQRDSDGWIAPNQKQPYELLDLFAQAYPQEAGEVEFLCSMPYQILSEQLNAKYLSMLLLEIERIQNEAGIEGIIICHGTDTLVYSATMLDLLFQESRIPVCLVSSNYPLSDERANGLDNFLCALKAFEQYKSGVMVSYRNADGKTYLHRGRKLLLHQTFEDSLFSMHQEYLGYYDSMKKWHENTVLNNKNEEKYVKNDALKKVICGKNGEILRKDTHEILWLKIYPGSRFGTLSPEVKYVILEAYHSGTVRIDEEFQGFLDQAKKNGTHVYVVGIESVTEGYETIKAYEKLGLEPVLNVTPIELYCKLWLEISEGGALVK